MPSINAMIFVKIVVEICTYKPVALVDRGALCRLF